MHTNNTALVLVSTFISYFVCGANCFAESELPNKNHQLITSTNQIKVKDIILDKNLSIQGINIILNFLNNSSLQLSLRELSNKYGHQPLFKKFQAFLEQKDFALRAIWRDKSSGIETIVIFIESSDGWHISLDKEKLEKSGIFSIVEITPIEKGSGIE